MAVLDWFFGLCDDRFRLANDGRFGIWHLAFGIWHLAFGSLIKWQGKINRQQMTNKLKPNAQLANVLFSLPRLKLND